MLALSPLTRADKLDTLKAEHPRILASADDFDRIAKLVKDDAYAKRWYESLRVEATELLSQPVPEYELRDGRRLLYVSREVLDRVQTLALLHRIEPKQAYVDRIWSDMEAAARFDHWNPDHFLDVAEMGLAFALAYDWLYDDWTDAQRKTMRDAMVRHAIRPALAAHRSNTWWTRTKINWNQVCHGGLIAVSLAIADHEPELAEQMLDRAVKALETPMKQYAPDGGYEEGPGYWAFGTIYNVIAIASLQSALGNDFGLSQSPGFGKTTNFPVQMIGTSDKFFNFGDNKERISASPALFWFAQRFYESPPQYSGAQINARWMLDRIKASAFALLWYDPNLIHVQYGPDLKANYKTAGVAVMRSGWGSDATFIGTKGGRVGVGHSQMDLGSFVFDNDGVRWFIDLGADDYNLPGYFAADEGGKRWQYYRNRAEGHNTLVINPSKYGGHRYGVEAEISQEDWTTKVDLTQAYGEVVHREFLHVPGSNDFTVLTDTIELREPGEVWWFAHTRATIELAEDGRSATLRQDGQVMKVQLRSPEGARLTLMDAKPLATSPNPKGQNPNNGAVKRNSAKGANFVKRGSLPTYSEPDPDHAVRKLAIHLEGVTDARIEVVFGEAD